MKHDVDSIYNIRLKSVDYLIEADRDAYQSSLAISHSLRKRIYNDNNKLQKELKNIDENLKQVDARFNKFKKLHFKSGSKDNQHFTIYSKSYKTLKEQSNVISNLLRLKK